jgi:ribosome-associated translation inhibitor RaiA
MELQVRTPHAIVKQSTRAYAEQKIGAALQKILGKEGSRADVEIADLGNGRGAPLMRVSVHVTVPHAKPHSVSADDPDVGAAIDLAADKILRAVKRDRQKRRDVRRQSQYNLPVVEGTAAVEEDEEATIQPITL